MAITSVKPWHWQSRPVPRSSAASSSVWNWSPRERPKRRLSPSTSNIGGSYTTHGVTATLVQAFHSSSAAAADGRPREIGTPCGFVLECPRDLVIYNTGDTGIFGDMALIAEMYHPDILMLPIGDFYTMGPRQAAKACDLVQPKWIVPQHYATFPGLPGTPAELLRHLPAELRGRVLTPAPGETIR